MKREIRLCSPLVLWRYGLPALFVVVSIIAAIVAVAGLLFPGSDLAYFGIAFLAIGMCLFLVPARLAFAEHCLEMRWLIFRKRIACSAVMGVERVSGIHYEGIEIALSDGGRFILPVVEHNPTGFGRAATRAERDDVMMLVWQHWQDSLLQGGGPYRARLTQGDEPNIQWRGQIVISSIESPSLFHQRPVLALVVLVLSMILGVVLGGLVSEQGRTLGCILLGALAALLYLVPARLELYDAHLGLRWLAWARYIPLHAVVEIERTRKFGAYESITLKFNAQNRMIVHVAKAMLMTPPKVQDFLGRLNQRWEIARREDSTKAQVAAKQDQRAREK